MSYIKQGATEKLTRRLDAAIKRLENGERTQYGSDDLNVFLYIREQIQPEVVAEKRREDDTNVGKLHEVANERLNHYEREADDAE